MPVTTIPAEQVRPGDHVFISGAPGIWSRVGLVIVDEKTGEVRIFAGEHTLESRPGCTVTVKRAASNAERQSQLRLRRASQGLHEVRGVYATDEEDAAIRRFAKALAAKRGSI